MTVDLNNADLDTLDALLAQTPEPLEPMDTVTLDGYLAGIAVQPRVLPIPQWLPRVFDADEARPLPETHAAAWLARCCALIERRFEVMSTDITDDAWFDPVIVDVDRLPPPSEYDEPRSPVQLTFAPWLDGFELALQHFPFENTLDDTGLDALARVRGIAQRQGDDVQAAIDALVIAVVALSRATEHDRFHVDTMRRAAPKVGRNDPCPCGSGRKFKVCHGATGV